MKRTISISIMSCDLLTDRNRLDDTERNVPAFAEKFTVVITVVLYSFQGDEHDAEG